jgi:SAM-dependent methyltransferase
MTTHDPSAAPDAAPPPGAASSDDAKPVQSDYDARYFATGLGLPFDESEPLWARFFSDIADHLVEQLEPRTVLDAGCAKGFLVAALAERGVEASGVDISEYAIESAVKRAEGRIRVHNLTEPLEGRWDLVTCIEVLEHMAPEDTQVAIDNVCAVTDRVLLSSTPHDFAEPSHVNVRPVPVWVGWFARRGFFRRTDLDLTYLSPWAVVFERRSLTAADVAYLYEVEHAPLREEVAVRQAELLEADRRIGALIAELDALRNPSTNTAAAIPDHSVERVIALTDEVIGLRSELSQLRYRYDLEVWAAVVEADNRRQQVEARMAEAETRAAASETRVAEVLGSRTWRLGQAFVRPAAWLRRRPRKSP